MSSAEMPSGFPPEGEFDFFENQDGSAELTLDYLGYDQGFTPQELAFATQRAMNAHDDALHQEFPVEAIPQGYDDDEVPQDVSLGPVGQAQVVLREMSHEAVVRAMPESLAGSVAVANEVTIESTEPIPESTAASMLDTDATGAQGPDVVDIRHAGMDEYLQAGRDADVMAYDRAAENPTLMTLQDAAVSLAGIRHALNAARAENPADTAAEELTLRNAARWVMDRTVASPADVTTLARWYNFAIDEAVNRRPDQPEPVQLQPAA